MPTSDAFRSTSSACFDPRPWRPDSTAMALQVPSPLSTSSLSPFLISWMSPPYILCPCIAILFPFIVVIMLSHIHVSMSNLFLSLRPCALVPFPALRGARMSFANFAGGRLMPSGKIQLPAPVCLGFISCL